MLINKRMLKRWLGQTRQAATYRQKMDKRSMIEALEPLSEEDSKRLSKKVEDLQIRDRFFPPAQAVSSRPRPSVVYCFFLY